MVGEGVRVGSLAVESLLGQLGVAGFFVRFAVGFALLALAGCCGHCWEIFWGARGWEGGVVGLWQ